MVADALLGRTVDDRYRVDTRIAVGGMATVYRALDLRLDRTVALKVMHGQWAEDPDFLSRFRAEARAAARLAQSNVVGVYDQGEWDGLVYLVMEYVPGRNLRAVLRDSGSLSPALALSVIDQVLQALDSAHRAGFVHRDIKPENVLVTPDGAIKVTDFGLARALRAPSSRTGDALIGTAAYLSPEQVSGEPTDERSDIYQAGVLLFELLTGRPPFRGDTSWEVAKQHVNGSFPQIVDFDPSCPAEVSDLVADATRRNPHDRIPTIGEFRARAVLLQSGLPAAGPLLTSAAEPTLETTDDYPLDRATTAATPAQPTERDSRGPEWRRRIGISSLVIALVAATGLLLWLNPLARSAVPNVTGTSESKAVGTLQTAGFTVGASGSEYSEKIPAGKIIRTDPANGANARDGSEVSLIVSLGPERYKVPGVRGETPSQATTDLADTYLSVAGQRKKFHDTIDVGLVIGTDPAKGTQVKRDAPITLLVSKGPAPVSVPNLNGISESSARSQLADVGLSASVTKRESDTVPEGDVIQTVPASGAKVFRGDRIELIVSEGPPPVAVPNVVDLPREEAIRELKAAGFKVEISEGIVTPLDRVFETDPSPGSLAPAGSTITVSIF